MAGSYNRCILAGNLTRDPEIRYTQTGKAVTKFTLAVNNPRNKNETTFVDIVAWDQLGETCNTYLTKGSNTLVEGRLVIRSYEDNDGNTRKATEVVIDNMQMLGSRRDTPDDYASEQQRPSHVPPRAARHGGRQVREHPASRDESAGDRFEFEDDELAPH
jgi:single-strand DNA-binding protein